jgi:hypothetical protein
MESTHIVEAFRKNFEEQVPSIRLNTFRSRSSEIANRISVEAKTERHEFDVTTVNPITAHALKSRGLIKPHLHCLVGKEPTRSCRESVHGMFVFTRNR